MEKATVNDIVQRVVEIVALLGGLSGLAALVSAIFGRRSQVASAKKTEAETDQQIPADAAATLAGASAIISEEYRKLLDEYQESTDKKICELNLLLAEQQKKQNESDRVLRHYGQRIAYLMTGIQMLLEQFTTAGITPCWEPNDWHSDMDRRDCDEKPNPVKRE